MYTFPFNVVSGFDLADAVQINLALDRIRAGLDCALCVPFSRCV